MEHKITAIKSQKRNLRRVNIYLDGEFAFGLERIVAGWLQVGQVINDEKIAQLKAEDKRESDYQRAVNFISYRTRSEAEIRRKLEQGETSQESTDRVVEQLKRSGLLDDNHFAQAWVENRSEFRPRGKRALSYELKLRGVSADIIEQTIETIDEEKLAYQAGLKYARKLANLDWKNYRTKLTRHLAQRGFNYETITDVTLKIWAEVHHEEKK
jgi:regulatory protein